MFQVLRHTGGEAQFVFRTFHRVDRDHLGSAFAGECSGNRGTREFLSENGLHMVLPAEAHEFCELPRRGLSLRVNVFNADLLQTEIAAEIAKRRVTGHKCAVFRSGNRLAEGVGRSFDA